MFVVKGKTADAALRDGEEVNSLISHIASAGYHPSIRSMVKAAFESANQSVSTDHLEEVLAGRRYARRRRSGPNGVGDIFFTDEEAFIVHPTGSNLTIYSIRRHDIESSHEEFCEVVADAAESSLDGRRLRGMSFEWNSEEIERDKSEIDAFQSREVAYSEQEASQSETLSVEENRKFLIRLAQLRGKARSTDALSDTEDQVITELLEKSLVDKEYLVLCRRDSHTILSLKEKDQLSTIGEDMKCTECGRPIQEELVQDIFALTEAGTKLLEGSHWMTIWITDLLNQIGLSLDDVRWNAESGGDEIDIIANIHGNQIFFELKDREFGVGDAYPFLYRVEQYGGSHGVVISTNRVADEVKDLFSDRNPGIGYVPIETIEGVENIKNKLPALANQLSMIPAYRTVSEFADPLGIELVPILRSWMESVSSSE